jgi:hypothetical protein
MSGGAAVSLKISSQLCRLLTCFYGMGLNGRRPYSNKIAIKNPSTGSPSLQSLGGSSVAASARSVCAMHNLSLPKAFAVTCSAICE